MNILAMLGEAPQGGAIEERSRHHRTDMQTMFATREADDKPLRRLQRQNWVAQQFERQMNGFIEDWLH
jgi:hypothetical protein